MATVVPEGDAEDVKKGSEAAPIPDVEAPAQPKTMVPFPSPPAVLHISHACGPS